MALFDQATNALQQVGEGAMCWTVAYTKHTMCLEGKI